MNDHDPTHTPDVEELLGRLTPRRADRAWRDSVVSRVVGELESAGEGGSSDDLPICNEENLTRVAFPTTSPRLARWDLRLATTAVFLLVAGVGLNVVVSQSGATRIDRLLASPEVPRIYVQYGEVVESVTDPETGRTVQERLLAMRGSPAVDGSSRARFQALQRRLTSWALTGRGWLNESSIEGRQMGRDRDGRDNRGASYRCRAAQLASEWTA
jgi:hypothetical protein